MSRRQITSEMVLNAANIERINEAVKDLLERHAKEVEENINDSDARTATVNLAVELDCSESAPSIDVKMRFSSSVTDRRKIMCEDPNQETFGEQFGANGRTVIPGEDEPKEEKPRGKRGRKPKVVPAEPGT